MMFDIFGKGNGFCIPSGSSAFKVFEEIKEEALNGLLQYDSLINMPDNSKEQKKFLENERDCFMTFLDSGYGIIIMWRLLDLEPISLRVSKDLGVDWRSECRKLQEQMQLSFLSLNFLSGIIKELASIGRLKLGVPPSDSLSREKYDFLNDGFDYSYRPEISDMIDSIEATAKKRMEGTMRMLNNEFEYESLSREQRFYFDLEAESLLVFLKEYFRGIVYPAMLSLGIATHFLEGDEILIENSLERMSVALQAIELLTTHGVVQLSDRAEG